MQVTGRSSIRPAVPATEPSLLMLSHAMERAFDIADQPASFPALILGLFSTSGVLRRGGASVRGARHGRDVCGRPFRRFGKDLPPGCTLSASPIRTCGVGNGC